MNNPISRRTFIAAATASILPTEVFALEQIIDIHQHTHYSGRTDEVLIAHQNTMGISKTVLLPAGSKLGLEADIFGNDSALALVKKYPKQYYFFANELPDIAETKQVIEKYLKLGAIGIGEQKYFVDSDSRSIELLAEIAREFRVPVLLHFQHGKYNMNFVRFHEILEKFPTVNFIGHAQTFWNNIDSKLDQSDLYPKHKVTRGGITDRLLSDYANMYADMSAGSGLNAMTRDEDHAREFLKRHQDKLLYGSDCNDTIGNGEKCSGAQQIAMIRRLSPSQEVTKKILSGNARRVLKI